MAKTVLFESGLSFGKGMTYQLDEKIHNGITYLDTPGLADINMRKGVAKAITKGLKKNGNYQIFFVVTLEAGRLRPADLTTIKLILENAKDITSYSLIINKLSRNVYDDLQNENRKELKRLASEVDFHVGKNRILPNLLLVLNNLKLDDAKNELMKIDNLDEFIATAPNVIVDPNNIKDIPGDDKSFEEAEVSVKKESIQFRSDKERMMKEIKETEESYNKPTETKVKFFQHLFIFHLYSAIFISLL